MSKNHERTHALQVRPGSIPYPEFPHIAIAGRSNVGKSTLLNAVLGHNYAKVSQNPGRTKAIYCYQVPKQSWIAADLPGFGYAKVSHQLRALWQDWVSLYFGSDSPVRATILCVDSKIPRQPVDLAFMQWLAETGHNQLLLVGTKSDRMNQKTKAKARRQLADWSMDVPGLDVTPILISAIKGTNMNVLYNQIKLAMP